MKSKIPYRPLAVLALAGLIAACGPGDPAQPTDVPTAEPTLAPIADDPGAAYPSADPYVPVDTSASLEPVVDEPASDDATASDAASPSPSPSESPSPSPTPSPTATPTPRPLLEDLAVRITSRSHNSIIGGKFSCVVEVSNPSNVPRTGKITVTFVHDATPEADSPVLTQNVSLPAGGSTSYTFTDTVYHPLSEDALVRIVTDPYTP